MGCTNSKMVKRSKTRDRTSEEAVYATERKPQAAAEPRLVEESTDAALGDVSLFDSMPQELAASASLSSGNARESSQELSGMRSTSQVSSETDTRSSRAALIGASTETSRGCRGKHQRGRHRGFSSDGDTLSSLSVFAEESAKLHNKSSSHISTSGSNSLLGDKDKKDSEKNERGCFNDNTIADEMGSQEEEEENSVAPSRHHSASHPEAPAAAAESSMSGSRRHLSFEASNNSLPPEVKANMWPKVDALEDGAGSDKSPSRGVPDAMPASSIGVQIPHAETLVSSLSHPQPYDRYSDLELLDEGDDLPPYEWAPRTFPVRSPLWIGGPADMTRWEYTQSEVRGLAAGDPHVRFQDPLMTVSDRVATIFDPAVAEGSYGACRPPTAHTFRAHLSSPPWSSTLDEDRRNMPRAPTGVFNHTPSQANAPIQTAHSYRQQLEYQAVYERDADVYHSPAEYGVHTSASQRVDLLSLVDVYVSEDRSHAAPPLLSGAYTFYPSSALSPPYTSSTIPDRHLDRPMPSSHRPPVISAAAQDLYQDGDGSRSGNMKAPQAGVPAHRYKPVTYLFDCAMGDWLQSRQMTSPQRELYTEATNM